MNWKAARLTLSTSILAFALALATWGLYGMATFEDESGWGHDPRFFIFDSAVAPFFWGSVLLLMGYLMRFHFRLHALSLLAVFFLSAMVWGEYRLSKKPLGAEFFYVLLAVCAVLVVLAVLDRYIQKASDFLLRKARRRA